MKKISVLFVCMGNICRSPTGHGVFEQLVKEQGLSERIIVDSAGTHAYHVGEQPDSRSQSTAMKHGYDLSYQRARRVQGWDFEEFDYILAMDAANLASLKQVAQEHELEKVHLLMSFAPNRPETEVPDPYYGGDQGFENVFQMVKEACENLLDHIKAHDLT